MPRYYNASIKNLSYRLRSVKNALPKYLIDAIDKHEALILDLIRYEQLYKEGINGRGEKISSYAPYTSYTKRRKYWKGQPYDRVTLKDTGKFYSKFTLARSQDGFFITSYDNKTSMLMDKYGKTIFRLTNHNFTTLVRDKIKPFIKRKIAEEIGVGY